MIAPGKDFVTAIREELNQAKAAVVLLSTDAIDPPANPLMSGTPNAYVLAEALYAQLKKPIIPVEIPPLEPEGLPPPFTNLKTLKWADSESIHAALRMRGVTPSQKPKPIAVFRQDVFTTGIPTYTEVDRSNLREFQDLQANLRMKGRIVRLWGATQTGKTVLARKALSKFMPIELKGKRIKATEDFYNAIAIGYAPELPSDSRRLRVIRFLTDAKRPIIIDDFHHVPTEVQRDLIEDAKDLIENDVNIVLVSIPDCVSDIVGRNAELRNRSVAIKAPRWTAPQLRQIPRLGFEWLNVNVHPKLLDEIICQSYGNPHLVQEYCYKICEGKGILKTFDRPTPVSVSRALLISIFKDVGASKNYNLLPLFKGDADADQMVRVKWGSERNARRVPIAGVLLIVLDRKGAFSEVLARQISSRAAQIVPPQDRQHITEQAVLAAGAAFINALKAAEVSDTVIGQTSDRFYIQHADFKVHLHWSLVPHLTQIQPQLEKMTSEHTDADILAGCI